MSYQIKIFKTKKEDEDYRDLLYTDGNLYRADMGVAFKSMVNGGEYSAYIEIPWGDSSANNGEEVFCDLLDRLYELIDPNMNINEFIEQHVTDYGRVFCSAYWWKSGIELWKTRKLEEKIKNESGYYEMMDNPRKNKL